jgi:hypothetical protein
MKSINKESQILLQEGIYSGEILEAECNTDACECRIVVGFVELGIRIQYSMNFEDVKGHSEFSSLIYIDSDETDLKVNEIIGQKRRFKVELLNAKTSTGSVGINVISGLLPELSVDEQLGISVGVLGLKINRLEQRGDVLREYLLNITD